MHYEVTNVDAGATYAWQIINNTSGATITNSNGIPANGAVFADVDPGGPGSYAVQATPSNAGGSGGSCSVTTSVQANTSTTDLTDIQPVCPGTIVNSAPQHPAETAIALSVGPWMEIHSATRTTVFRLTLRASHPEIIRLECDTISKLTATAGFDSYSWTGPTPVNDPSGTCGPNKACLLIDKTGLYTVNVTDSNSCSGSQTAQLCFALTSPAPSAPARAYVTVPGSESKVSAQKPIVRDSLLAKVARILLLPF